MSGYRPNSNVVKIWDLLGGEPCSVGREAQLLEVNMRKFGSSRMLKTVKNVLAPLLSFVVTDETGCENEAATG